MLDVLGILTLVALLLVLDALAIRYGADSRGLDPRGTPRRDI